MFALDDAERAVEKLLELDEPVDVARVSKLQRQVELLWLRAVDAHARSDDWAVAAYVNPAASVRDACGLTQQSAARDVALARKLRDLPAFSAAMATGAISRAHVAPFADACTPDRAGALRALEEEFVAAAKLTNSRQFRQIVDRYASALDGDDGAGHANAQHARRRLHLSETIDGMWKLDGLLEPEHGAKLSKLLRHAVWEVTKADPTRAPPRRSAPTR